MQRLGTPSAVLILFGIQKGKYSLLLVRRSERVGTHQGQMAFPGGVATLREMGDTEGDIQTALRETWEEVGISSEQIKVLGKLPKISTMTGFWITPVVGVLKSSGQDISMRIDSREIAEVVWIPLDVLLDSKSYQEEVKMLGKLEYRMDVFQVEDYKIWGATGAMIKNLLERVEEVDRCTDF